MLATEQEEVEAKRFVKARHLSQSDIDQLPNRYQIQLTPGWYWVEVFPTLGHHLPHFTHLVELTPFAGFRYRVAMFINTERKIVL